MGTTGNPIYGALGAAWTQAQQLADQRRTADEQKKVALQTAASATFQNLLGQGMNQDTALRLAGTLHGLDFNTLAGTLPSASTDRFGWQAEVQRLKDQGGLDKQASAEKSRRYTAGLNFAQRHIAQGGDWGDALNYLQQSDPENFGNVDLHTFQGLVTKPVGVQTTEARNQGALDLEGKRQTDKEKYYQLQTPDRLFNQANKWTGTLGQQGVGLQSALDTLNTMRSTPAGQPITLPQGPLAPTNNLAEKSREADRTYNIHDLEIDLHNRALAETRAHHERQDKAMLYATDQRARAAMDRNETTKELAKIRAGALFYGPKLSQLSAHDRTQLNDLTYQRALAYKARETAQKDLDYATSNNDKEGIATAQAALDDSQGKVDSISAHIEDFFSAVTPDQSANPFSGPGAPGLPAIPPAGVSVPTVNVPGAGTMQIGHQPAVFGALPPADPAFDAWKKKYGHAGPGGTTTYTGTARGPHPMPRTKQTKLFR